MREENVFENPSLPSKDIITEEQRVRISQNFRAAKALLSRKRPLDSPSPSIPHRNHPKNEDQNNNIHRRPLSELQVNTPSPIAVKAPYLTDRHCIRSCPEWVSVKNGGNRVNNGGGVIVEAPRDDGLALFASSTVTPIKQFEGAEVIVEAPRDDGLRLLASYTITPTKQFEYTSSNLNDAFSSPSVFDDDFDDAILQEIDAICEQRSAVKMEKQASNEDSSVTYEKLLEDEGHSLKEIDALCEQRSAGKMEKQGSNGDSSATSEKLLEAECHSLKEIDALCKQRSAVKTEKQGGSSEDSSVKSEEILKTEIILDIRVDEPEARVGSPSTSQAMNIKSLPKAYMDYMQSLNDQQKEAACSDISIPLMIIAGPGSGKTSTMVGRVLMLLNEGIGPANILAMTFTIAAASEMRDRIGAVAGKSAAKELMISTFHSFCLQLCRSHAEKLERTSEFLIYGPGQQRRAIIEAVRLLEVGQNLDADKPDKDSMNMNSAEYFKDKSKKWQKFVTQAKSCGRTPSECQKMGDEIGATVLGNYDGILKSCNALDYHDLISCSVKLLTDFPEVYKECQDLWKAVVIDEFQDTSSMQYNFLRILASHNRITIVGDEDQSIFSFNGADVSGFASFRKDFPNHKEIRLTRNYRSTRCIVDAASSLIHNNAKRCPLKQVFTENSCGSKITVKECYKEDAQCAFVVDKILEIRSDTSDAKFSFGSVAVLYRRQISGKVFQTAFRNRKIPFNVHGVAFYRKKVVKAVFAMLRTTLPSCDDGSFRQVFKAFLPCDKEEKKKVVDHIDKIATSRKISFISAAGDIFAAKISGTFKRSQLTQGRKVLSTLDMISKLVHREQSISTVITSVANMLPQKYLFEQRAVADNDGGKLLNEDNDLRSVLQYLLDDVSDFLSSHFSHKESERDSITEEKGCAGVLKAFIDYISTRESENFRSRKRDNGDSVTLTTIHQSKGLEWDTVFIIKANESEIPLLHEFKGVVKESGTSLEEERRLLYVAMTRARKKLYILYVTMDSNWQMLQPSRFLKEIPNHLLDVQAGMTRKVVKKMPEDLSGETDHYTDAAPKSEQVLRKDFVQTNCPEIPIDNVARNESIELVEAHNGNSFLKRFNVEERSIVSHLFNQWAKKKAFQEPKRLLDKIGFVIDERLRIKATKHKDVLRSLKSYLRDDEAFGYAEHVLRWEKIPADQRAHIMREKQEHFQKLRIENAMGSSEATPKQISYLQSLGCTIVPTSRLHASRLIEQYKSL